MYGFNGHIFLNLPMHNSIGNFKNNMNTFQTDTCMCIYMYIYIHTLQTRMCVYIRMCAYWRYMCDTWYIYIYRYIYIYNLCVSTIEDSKFQPIYVSALFFIKRNTQEAETISN